MKLAKLDITNNRYEFIALAALVMALNALAIDIMLPALPEIGDAIAVVSENHRQYVITSFLIGFGISQLFFWPALRCNRSPQNILYRRHDLHHCSRFRLIYGELYCHDHHARNPRHRRRRNPCCSALNGSR